MDPNYFVSRLKANGTEKDFCDLAKVIEEYKRILSKLPSKDRGVFCLNVLSILCRNTEVPSWRDNADQKLLLSLSVDCVRKIQLLEKNHQVKTLACIFHMHRYFIRLKPPIVSELVLKLSCSLYECDVKLMLAEHAKTYCSLLVDRVNYLQVLKAGKVSIVNHLPKLTEDIVKVIQIYDTAHFCINALKLLILNLNYLYSERHSVELNKVFGKIFDGIENKLKFNGDVKSFRKLSEKELMDLFAIFNDCFYIIFENSSKNNFKDFILTSVVDIYTSLLDCPAIKFCYQHFYCNIFCNIFTNAKNTDFNPFKNLLESCETAEKLGYTNIMNMQYPYINQLLKLYIEYLAANTNLKEIFTSQSEEDYLKIIILMMRNSRKCPQLIKCDNCKTRSGVHDALRLSFTSILLVKQSDDIDNILPFFTTIIEEQYIILKELKFLKCNNHEKYYRKVQIDVHNTAIALNKSNKYVNSIRLFSIYLENEINNFQESTELRRNISRALFNKSICELDCKKYEDALIDAFLSLVFACPEGLDGDKYIGLVMDVKAKAVKASEEERDRLLLVSVLDACNMYMEYGWYGDLKPFFVPLKFSVLLKHEFSIYAKLWPSIVPIAGVWRSLHQLLTNKYNWVSDEEKDTVLSSLYDVILETSAVVRTINNDYYKDIICDLVAKIDETPAENIELRLAHAALLFLKAEYDLHDAGEKYAWKIPENPDPEQMLVTRTVSQEFEATRRAIEAVKLMTDILPDINKVVVTDRLKLVLEIASIFVQQLLHLSRQRHALQLAYVCCVLAEHIGDKLSYIRNAGVLLSHADKQTDKLDAMIKYSYKELMTDENSIDAVLGYICDIAMYRFRIGDKGTAARLVQTAQYEILKAYEKYPDVVLGLSTGRLMEAQCLLCGDSGHTSLSAINAVQRHYLAMSKVAPNRHASRLLSLSVKARACACSERAVRRARALLLRRRARAWAARALAPAALALARATILASIGDMDSVIIENRLKYILGLQINESLLFTKIPESKPEIFTPKQDIEIMLENMTFKKTQISPSMPCITIPGFRIPDFLKHKQCDCYACEIPLCYILSACTLGWEAAVYFRAKEQAIARNYFDGASKCFQLAERKLMQFEDKTCEEFIVETMKRGLMNELKSFEVEIMIERAFFELSVNNFRNADEIIVQMHDILKEYDICDYLRTDVMNLEVATAELRRNGKKNVDVNLAAELEALKLSPAKTVDPPKTPEIKAKAPPKIPKVIVKDEELPKKRKVIKLNLDETADETDKEPKKQPEFKIPVPVTKHVLENITPRTTRSKPNIFVTPAPIEAKTPMNEYSTPAESTPDVFFTPMSTLKTYSKQSLRRSIVKNLETEFSTSKSDISKNEMLEVSKSSSAVKDSKKTLKRATSPGKLVKNAPSRPVRKPPMKFTDK